MNKIYKFFTLLLIIAISGSKQVNAQTTVFFDGFPGTTGSTVIPTGTIGTAGTFNNSLGASGGLSGVQVGGTDPHTGAAYTSNQLVEWTDGNGGSSADCWDVVTEGALGGYLAPFNTTLSSNPSLVTWTFNMRTSVASNGNFAGAGTSSADNNSVVVLAASNATLRTAGNGYAVMFVPGATTIELVRYTGGIYGTVTPIATAPTALGVATDYASLQVTYSPITNTWGISARDDGGAAFANPAAGVYAGAGTIVDATYTGTAMNSFGFYSIHSAGAPAHNYSYFANYMVTLACTGGTPIVGPTAVCPGTTITLSNSVAGGTWSSSLTGNATVTPGPSAVATVTGVNPLGGQTVITYTTPAGCTSTSTVTVNATPAAIVGTFSVCPTATTQLSDAVVGTWTSGSTGIATVGLTTGLVTGVATGSAPITFTSTATGCTTTVTVTVKGVPGAISGLTSVCSGSSITLSNATVGGTWSSGTLSVATVTPGPGAGGGVVWGTGTIVGTSVITYSNGCASPTFTVTVNPTPAVIIGGPVSICAGGATVPLSDVTSGGTWSSGSVLVASIGSLTGLVTSGVFATGTSGKTVITYANGCGAAPTTTVTVNAPPGAITGNTTICSTLTTTLSDASNGTWSSGNVAVASVGSLTGLVTGGIGGTAVITYSNGCGSSTTTVTVIPPPAAITGVTTVCSGLTTTLSDAVTGGTWSSGSVSVASIGSLTGLVTAGTSGTAIISYSNGCGATATVTVTVPSAPTIISGTTTICLGVTSTLSNNGSPTGTWSSSNGVVATVGSISGTVTSVNAGTTIITAANICGSTTTLFTVSNPTPITGILTFCQDATTTLSDGVPGGTWSSGNIAVATTTGLVNDGVIYGTGPGLSVGCAPITYTLSTGCLTNTVVCTTPSPAAITGFFSVCAGSVINLTDAAAGGTWTSSNVSVATIGSTTGDVHGISGGVTDIDYALGTCFATATVTVNPLPATITGPTTVCVLSTITLSDATSLGVWSSISTTVSVSPGGTVTGVAAGPATITYTLGTGCIITTSITVNPLPAAITGNTFICYNQTSQLSDATPLGTWSSSAGGVANITAGPGVTGGFVTPTLPAGGVTTITYTLPTSCTAVTTFTVNPLPGPIIGATAICAGTTTALTDAPAGGTWNSSNLAAANIGLNSGIVIGQNVASSLSTGITYSLGTGCTATTTLTVNPLPAAIGGNLVICAGLTTQLSEATTGGTWTSSLTSVATVTPGPSPASAGLVTGSGVLITGTTVITYTLPTVCSATTTVTVNPLPGAIIGNTAVCSGLSIALTDVTSGGTWSSSNSTVASIDMNTGVLTGGVVLTPTIVTITYTLPTGCTKTINITVNPLPTAIAGNTTICAGLTTTLSDGSIGGTWSSSLTGVATVILGPGPGTIVTGVNPGPGIPSTTVITYILPTGCLMTTTVLVNPLPALITGVTTICSGLTTQLSDVTPGGTWSSSVITTATVGSTTGLVTGGIVFPSPLHSGITYTLNTGCIATTTVTVNPLPTVITGNTTICGGLTTQLSDGVAGGTWSSNTTSITIGSLSGLVTGSLVSTQSTATVSYTLGTGCIMTTTITVNPLPLPIAGNTIICAGLTTQLSDGSAGGTWSSSVITTATIGSTTGFVTGGNVATQLHSGITYTLPTGCIMTTTVTVNPLPLAITGANALCQGTTINLSDPTGGGVWSSSNTGLATIIPVGTTGFVSADTAGGIVGVDTITYTLGTGCLQTKTVTVNLQPGPVTGGPLPLCQGASGLLSDATPGGVWTSGNTSIATVVATAAGGVVTGHNVGTTNITYSIGSCSNAIGVFVNTQPGPITGITTMCNGFGTTLSDGIGGGVWSASNTVVSIAGIGVVTSHTPGIDTISYTIGSCVSTTTVLVNVQPGPITGISSFCDLSTTTLSDSTVGGLWSSSNTNASVGSFTGIVTGTMPIGSATGTSIITYTETIGGCFTARVVTINTQPDPITGATAICNGDSTQLADLTSGGVWSVDPATISIATVNSTGLVTGISAGPGGTDGHAIIDWTMTVGGCVATTTVTVHPLPSPISGIFYICQHSTTTLGDLTPLGTWSSSSSATASASTFTGLITGNNLGTATITYTLPTGCITTHTVTVIAIPSVISGVPIVCAGLTTALSDSTFGGAWTSGNPTIATVNVSSGVVTGVSSGTVVISYTLGTGCKAVTPVLVNPLSPITGITSVCIGQSTNLSDTTVGGTWSSNNTAIATVNQVTGVVTGRAAGTATISYNLPTGCTATALVTVNALPLPITGTTFTICDGLSTQLSDATPGGAWSSGNVSVATVDPTGIVTGSGNTGISASTVIITYTSGCFITTTITVNPLPQAITGNTGICLGLTSVLSDVTVGGTWSSGNSAVAPIDINTGLVTGLSAGVATITYTLPTTCIMTIPVTVYPLPAVITGNTTVCVGSTTTLSDATPGGAWFSSNPSVATVTFAGGVVTGVSPGTTVITVQVITGCVQTTTVTVNPLPPSISPAPADVCAGYTLSLFSGTGGVWTSSNTLIATIGSLSGIATGVAAGTSVISYTIGTGCAATTVLTVNPVPAVITGITTVCSGMTTNLSDATPGGVWSSGSPSIGTVDGFGVVYDVAPAGTFVVTYTLSTGCFRSVTITINPPPTAIGGPTQVCQGAQITLNDGVFGGVWTSSNTAVATIDPSSGLLSGVITGSTTSGSTIVTYTMGGGSCFVTQLITVNPLPAVITGITSVCAGLTTTLSDATAGGTWSSLTTTVATIDMTQGIVTGVAQGTSQVSYTLPTGCASTTTVTVNPLPAPISGNTNICLGDTRTLSDSSPSGTWSSSNSSVTTVGSATGVVYGNGLGVDTITYTLSITGCIMTTTVAVHPLPAIFAVTGGGTYCGGGSGVHIGLSGSEIGVEYLLYLGSTPTGTFMGTGSALDFGLQTTAGTYTVVAINTFTTCSNSMSGSATISIIPSPLPSVSIGTGVGDTICAGTSVTFTATGVNAGTTPTYQWSVNGTAVGTGVTYSYVPSNGNMVVVSMTSSLQCAYPVVVRDTVIMTVLAPERPSVGLLISPADTVCQGTAVTLTAIPSFGGYTPIYLWNVDGIGVGTTASVYTYIPTDGDIVYCRMVSDYRCRLTDTVSSAHEVITVDSPLIPVVTIVTNPGWVIGLGTTDTLHAVVTNGGPSPTYQWYENGVPVPGATTSEFVSNNFSSPNEDSVGCLVMGSGYCRESSFGWLYIVVNPQGVHQLVSAAVDLSVIPNPNSGTFTLKGTLGTTSDEVVSLELTDVLGQVVYKEEVQTRGGRISEQVNLGSTLANGMYMLSVHSASANRVFHIVIEQ